jgi:hypothetical protein
MLASILLLIPILICGGLGATIGYVFRYRLQLRRLLTVVAAVLVFIVLEVTSGTLSSKYTIGENLIEQLELLPPFIFLYLPPTSFMSFFVARRFRAWWT